MTALLPDGPIDTMGMYDAILGMPEQIAVASGAKPVGAELPDIAAFENVLILGMGASGIVGDIARVLAGPFCALPILVQHGYSIPSLVSASTLCIAVSYSGTTEETLEAAQEASHAEAFVVTVGTGGPLADVGAAHIEVSDRAPAARCAIGTLTAPVMTLLERLGAFPGAGAYLDEAVTQLERRREELTSDNDGASRLARRIGRTMPIVYGGGDLGGLAARRWKTQVNENAKAPAFCNALPELLHNELAGWGQHGDMTRQVFTHVALRHDHEHPQVGRAFDAMADLVDEVMGNTYEVRAEGDSPLAQFFDLVFYGDVVSYHLSQENEIDPGPVDAVDRIRATLAN